MYNTESLVRVRTKVYPKIRANWKLLMENFMEYVSLQFSSPRAFRDYLPSTRSLMRRIMPSPHFGSPIASY